jgi:hypothetical protein
MRFDRCDETFLQKFEPFDEVISLSLIKNSYMKYTKKSFHIHSLCHIWTLIHTIQIEVPIKTYRLIERNYFYSNDLIKDLKMFSCVHFWKFPFKCILRKFFLNEKPFDQMPGALKPLLMHSCCNFMPF